MKKLLITGFIMISVFCLVSAVYAGAAMEEPRPTDESGNPAMYGLTAGFSAPFILAQNGCQHFYDHNARVDIQPDQVGYQQDAVREPSIPYRAARK